MKILPPTDSALWQVAEPVTNPYDQVVPHIDRMKQVMDKHRGTGLAAPQCGIPLRFFIYGGRKMGGSLGPIPFAVIVNPVISWRSEDHRLAEEGCLSFPGRSVPVGRPESIRVSYGFADPFRDIIPYCPQTENKLISGYMARLFQHEIDHLDGVCIFSRPVLPPIPEENVEENLARHAVLLAT